MRDNAGGMNMNSVNIMGRIATDLTLRPVRSSAGVVLNFRVAVDRYAGGGKVTDFICNNGKASACLTGSGSLDGGVEGEQIGLRRNI